MTSTRGIHAEARGELLAAHVAAVAPLVRAWCDVAEIERRVAEQVDEEIGRATDPEFGKFFVERLGVGEPEDYLQRLVQVEGRLVLCGLRLFGGDASKAFVEVVATTAPLNEAVDAAMSVFARFNPIAVRIESAGESCPASEHILVPDTMFYAEHASVVAGSGAIAELEPASLREAECFVVDCYAAFAESDPELVGRVPPASREELEECAREGRLTWWLLGDERAGLIGVCPATLGGLAGMLIVEECVHPAFRGRGSAAMAQRAVAAQLPRTDVLMGTIDASNHASRRTAQAVGRRVVSQTWFASVDGRRP